MNIQFAEIPTTRQVSFEWCKLPGKVVLPPDRPAYVAWEEEVPHNAEEIQPQIIKNCQEYLARP
jgi:hypothetical protein